MLSFSGAGLRRVLAGAVVLIAVAQTASGSAPSHLRSRRSQQQQQVHNGIGKDNGFEGSGGGGGDGGGGLGYDHGRRLSNGGGGGVPAPFERRYGHGQPRQGRSLKSTRDPQCNLPEAFPCTLNTTAIGMIESGFATYYDDTCESNGFEGCFTDDIPACRTCYLSTELYMAATNATVNNRPNWVMCPCCVGTTLEDNHFDVEVMAFDYSVFNVSEISCTDSPTQAPAPAAAMTPTPAPMVPAPTPDPMVPAPTPDPTVPAPTLNPMVPAPTPDPTVPAPSPPPTAEPEEVSRELDPPTSVTPAPTVAPPSPDSAANGAGTGTENLDTAGGDDGLSMGAKVGIGAGAAVGVIVLGAAGFGIMKARGRT